MAARQNLQPATATKPPSSSAVTDSRLLHRLTTTPSATTASLEERAAIHHREIQTLLLENQRLAATHVAIKQDFAAVQLELRSIASAAAEAKARSDSRARDLYERSLKADADSRFSESAAAELDRVRGDARKLAASRDDLAKELKAVEGDLAGAREGLKQVSDVRAEIESVRSEILRGRAAIEQEKKNRALNLEYRKAMEEKMVSMASEIEKLHAELANTERRARAAAAAANPSPGYGGAIPYGSDMGYGGQPLI